MTMHASLARVISVVPDSAPFNAGQRALLNRFFTTAFALDQVAPAAGAAKPANPFGDDDDGDAPWHDPAMDLDARMVLAKPRPLRRRMMAAMAQQDCGQCGYNCEDYSNAIAQQAEPRLNLCAPGGKATARMLKALVEEMGGGVLDPDAKAAKDAEAAAAKPVGVQPGYARNAAVLAEFVGRRRLNGKGSAKVTNHIDIDISQSGIDYVVGDSLGVFPANDPALADAIIAQLDYPPDFPIADKPLRDTLIEDMSLGAAPDMLFQFISYMVGGDRKKKALALAKGQDPDGDAATLDVLAALKKFPGIRPDPEAFVEALEPLQPRLYSISSSPKTTPGVVSLTVDAVRYDIAERTRLGVASTWLDDRIAAGAPLKVYVQKAHGFALPSDPKTPIIMVGPGTGIAPFRAFIEERAAIKALGQAPGQAWLFFGHQKSATDFFYEEELGALQTSGVLTTLTTAWSRDGAQKVYVQDRMREAGADLWAWLEAGAHFYICGDATRMAKDVEAALTDVVAQHGGRDATAAKAYIAKLKADARYQADVY
jgi:sulfite reductase (NADPH) flavoprotein alpha-component